VRHAAPPTGNNGACGVSSLRLAWIDVRAIVNALRSKHRICCQWRLLPADFPPMSSVRSSFDTWSRDGTFVKINDTLRQPARHALDCNLAPSISVLDSQSTTTTEADGECSFDGRNKVNGRKQQCRVDTNGFLGHTLVHPAYIQGILSQSRIERSLSLSWFYRNCS
jgi:transposase